MLSSLCHSMAEPHPLTIPILEQAGFGQIAKIRHLKVDYSCRNRDHDGAILKKV